MNKRRSVQEQHEQFIVDAFISWWALRTGEKFQVIERPHPLPPEAILRSQSRSTWIEVTDAFHSKEWAQDIYSYATPDEPHTPMGPGPYMNMDAQMAARFAKLLKKKLSKASYAKPNEKYGPGILLVGMHSPWFDGKTCELMHEECRGTDWSADLGYFASVFLSFRSLNQQTFVEWKWRSGNS